MSNKISNYYEHLPKEYKKKSHNPYFKNHRINIPFRMLIVGASGSGKTNVAIEILKNRMNKTFEKVIVCCKSANEPLYQWLKSDAPEDMFEIHEGIEEVPRLDDLAKYGQTLVIFDDLVLEKNQSVIEDYFIRGRKIGGGISCMYLTQSFFKTPKLIRLQCNYIILKKLASDRDLKLLLSEYSLGINQAQLLSMYDEAISVPNSFLLIDIDSMGNIDPKVSAYSFREGFLRPLRQY